MSSVQLSIRSSLSPAWLALPYNNDRTAYAPFGFPVILQATNIRTAFGANIPKSEIIDVRIAIEKFAGFARVVGHDNIDRFFPTTELYALSISRLELVDRLVVPSAYKLLDSNGNVILPGSPVVPTQIEITSRSGHCVTMSYDPTSDYYDLSDAKIEVDGLPDGRYRLSYQARHYKRILSEDGSELICIDDSDIVTTVRSFPVNHPGEVLSESVRLTPEPYFSGQPLSEEQAIKIYRPLTDALQNIFDEQKLLGQINWANDVHPNYVPYLASLLGVNLSYFPKSTDETRRRLIQNATRIQRLKGSKRAIIDMFEMFGYLVDIMNLRSSVDGRQFLNDNKIIGKTDVILRQHQEDGYGGITVPLVWPLKRLDRDDPNNACQVKMFVVDKGSQADQDLSVNVDAIDPDFHYYPAGHGVRGFLHSRIDVSDGSMSIISQAASPVSVGGLKLDLRHNSIRIDFNKYMSLMEDNVVIYALAHYNATEISGDASLISNRFNVSISDLMDQEVSSDVIQFLIDYLLQIKSFHSILNAIICAVSISDSYQVTDLCRGVQYSQDPSYDIGIQQVPPAIIPNSSDGCDDRPETLGYKKSDINYRKAVIKDLSDNDEQTLVTGTPTDSITSEITPSSRGNDATTVTSSNASIQIYAPGVSQTLGSDSDHNHSIGSSNSDKSIVKHGSSSIPNARNTYDPLTSNDYYCYGGRVTDALFHSVIFDGYEVMTPSFEGHYMGIEDHVGIGDHITTVGSGWMNRIIQNRYQTNRMVRISQDRIKDARLDNLMSGRIYPDPPIYDDLSLPGCRFMRMSGLENDFISSYKARPYDEPYDRRGPCCRINNPLNAKLTGGLFGQMLAYDDVDLIYVANGANQDIPDLSGGSMPLSAENYIHKVYMITKANHPAITINQVDILDIDPPIFDYTNSIGTPYFSSALSCDGDTIDYQDGYASSFGTFNVPIEDITRVGGITNDILDGMDWPTPQSIGTSYTTLQSGVREGMGKRLDYGDLDACEQYRGMSQNRAHRLPSHVSPYRTSTGFDWSHDIVQNTTTLNESSNMIAIEHLFDGSLSMFPI